jgi:hypothetical protein
MKDIEKIIADLQAWVEEDKENRAIALVAVQKTEDKEESYCSEQHTVTQGFTGYLVDAFQNALNDKDPENGLHKVLKHAILREAMTGLIKIADRLLKKSDKKSENSSEEGKEADHE